jgi:hypothetical protein
MSKRPAPENPFFIPWDIHQQIFNGLPLGAIEERFNLLRCSKAMAQMLEPSIKETIAWIQQYVKFASFGIPNYRLVERIYQQTHSSFLAQLTSYLLRYHDENRSRFIHTLSTADPLKIFSCFHYISMLYKHSYQLDPLTDHTTRFDMVENPKQLTRLKNIYISSRDAPMPMTAHKKIKIASKLPIEKSKQIKAIEKAIKNEKDADVKQMMQFYNNRYGDAPSKIRAKCYTLTKSKRKLREPRGDDIFGQVVYREHHIDDDRNRDFSRKCFVCTGNVTLAWRLLTLRVEVLDKMIQ